MKNVFLAVTIALAAACAGCASAIAKTPPERPALEVPAPPAKVVEPTPQPEPATPEPVAELPTSPPTNVRPPRTAGRETAKPDVKPEAPAAETAPPLAAPPAPAPQLRTPGSPDSAEAAKQVQIIIDRADKALTSIDARRFSKAKRVVYDNARGMLTQAQDALKKSDFDNARKLAIKVEDTAKELSGK